MRQVILNQQMSLDGIVQGPGGPEEDPSGGFEHGGWAMPYYDESTMGEASVLSEGQTGGLLIGRRTYEIFAGYWPNQGDDHSFAKFLNTVPKYVASRTLEEPLGWNNSHLLEGDVADAVRKLKEGEGRDLVILGSGELAQTLLKHDLIDVYDIWIVPIVLGEGRRLFREGTSRMPLKVVKSQITNTGVAMMTYEPASE